MFARNLKFYIQCNLKKIALSLLLLTLLVSGSALAGNDQVQAEFIPSDVSVAEWENIQQQIAVNSDLQQQAYLKPSNNGVSDYYNFGWSVAVSGDTLVVGAYREASNATGVNGDETDNSIVSAGAAYVFTRANGIWSQQAYLKASNSERSDQFGYSVAISGNTIVVGARSEDSDATGVNGDETNNLNQTSGAAYVFTRSNGIWSQQAYLKASNTRALDFFGFSVAISGDSIVVGSIREDSDATGVNGDEDNELAGNSGAAYVFTRSNGTWTQQAYLKASNTGTNDEFGLSVAISADTLVVGAYQEDSNAIGVNGDEGNNLYPYAGAAYVFARTDTTWSQQAYLKASNTEVLDRFGYSVAISEDTVVVGAYGEDSDAVGVNGDDANDNSEGSGAVYVFTRAGTEWSQQAYLKASNNDAGDNFGFSVAISDEEIVVGANFEESNATGVNGDENNNLTSNSGAAYIFTRSASVWDQQAYLKASNTGASDYYGRSVAISAGTVIVGTPGEASNASGVDGNGADNSATGSGASYVYGISPGNLIFTDSFE